MKIKSISFLFGDERIVLEPNYKGRFELPYDRKSRGSYKVSYRETKVKDIVNHYEIKGADPVITLENGEKVRVYQAGEGSYMLTYPASIIEKFDKETWNRGLSFSTNMAEQFEFPWPDDATDW